MTKEFVHPAAKNPMLRTAQFNSPPHARGRVALGLTSAAAQGRFALQTCADCGAVQYPPREACHKCLSPNLPWLDQDGMGQLLSSTTLHHSNDLYFRDRLPWRLGLVQLDAGPTVMVHLHGDVPDAPTKVRVGAQLDRCGQAVLIGFPVTRSEHMESDAMLREMTCNPQFRKVLVTDGKTLVGQEIVRALVKAGADLVWVGHAQPWKKSIGIDNLTAMPQVKLVPLDLTDTKSVSKLAGSIGGKVDILINNAQYHRPLGLGERRGIAAAQAQMEINYFGLLRLAQEFGPALRSRSVDGATYACAWVNVLSIYALTSFPPYGTFSASKAAAYSFSQCLRAQMQPAGIRVINCFPGPIDDEWNEQMPLPKLAPGALANAIVKALQSSVEDIYPGDAAQELLERWRADPKVLEREIAAGG